MQRIGRVGVLVLLLAGCSEDNGQTGSLEAVWGKYGLMPGQFIKPRAIAIDEHDRMYLVDMRAWIQAFTSTGEVLGGWQTPDHTMGRPSGLAVDADGNVLVADSHYHRVLVYDPHGTLLRSFGGEPGLEEDPKTRTGVNTGGLVGEFGYIGDIAVDSMGNLYVAESQQQERITKLSPEGMILKRWGGRGPGPGQFQRIRALAFDERDRLYVADACNHRIQIFDSEGRWIATIGKAGSELGELFYPYDVAIAPDGTIVVCEYGNHRIQHFSAKGESLGVWGSAGSEEGQLWNPWAVGIDSKGRVHVVDSNNHRVQRIVF